jgi:uroporphyrinogen decarboxylase
MNSKDLIQCLFQNKELPQVPFIPLVWSLAAKVKQVTVKEMAADPGLMANALSDAQKLFGYDGILTTFDPSLEAEALGCSVEWTSENQPPNIVSSPLREGRSLADLNADFLNKGRLPAVLESAKRLNMVRGKEVAVIGVVTGPGMLGSHLLGESFWPELEKGLPEAKKTLNFTKKCCQDLIKAYCDVGINTVMVVEEMPGKPNESIGRQMKAACRSMWNILRYFQGSSILLAHGCTEDNLELLCNLGADGVIVGGASEAISMGDLAGKTNLCFGGVVPTQEMLSSDAVAVRTKAGDILRNCAVNRGFFLTTEWELPYDTFPQIFHEVISVVREYKPGAVPSARASPASEREASRRSFV